MHIPSISDFIRAHSRIAFAALAALLGVIGYLEIRLFPKKLGAYWTLSFAVFIAAFALFHSAALGALGPLLGVAVLLVGLVLLVRYYTRHRNGGERPHS